VIIDTEDNIISIEDNTDTEYNHDQRLPSWSGITDTEDNRDLWSYLYKRLPILKIMVIISATDILRIKCISYH
jgi:hypothetical protein